MTEGSLILKTLVNLVTTPLIFLDDKKESEMLSSQCYSSTYTSFFGKPSVIQARYNKHSNPFTQQYKENKYLTE